MPRPSRKPNPRVARYWLDFGPFTSSMSRRRKARSYPPFWEFRGEVGDRLVEFVDAQGFQRLLDIPGYDVAALVEKSGKSASHIYACLSLLQLIPEVAEAFPQERITASHANLIARLPQESQAEAFEQCWRKDWQDSEPHLLPAKHVSGSRSFSLTEEIMFQFTYKLKVSERVRAKYERHPRYNPERDGRGESRAVVPPASRYAT